MNKSISEKAVDWREGRRLRGWELMQRGWKQTEVAEALGVTQGAVSQWVKRARQGGVQGLRRRKACGGQPRLSPQQKAHIPLLLEQGAESFGFRGDIWTCGRIAELIRRTFGVSYHPAHVSRVLRECGWSLQKPVRRATQRDEAAIERWKTERWPQLKKRP
jgi:transposase